MKQLKLSRLFSLLLALTLALTPCLAGLAEEGNESQNSTDIVLRSGTEDGAGEGTGEGGGTGTSTGTGEGTGAGGSGETTTTGDGAESGTELTDIEVSPMSMQIEVGKSKGFTVKPVPATATLPSVNVAANGTNVEVLNNNTIKANSPGQIDVVVSVSANGKKFEKTIQVTVVQTADMVEVTPKSRTAVEGDTLKFTATVSPANANQQVEWSVSPATAANLTPNGLSASVTFLSEQENVTITATAKDSGKAYGSATVKVLPKVASVALDMSEVKLEEGTTIKLKATVLPANATQQLKFESSDKNVATVNDEGVVTAVAEGTAMITAISTDGTNKSASCKVKVGKTVINVPVTAVKVSPEKVVLDVGGSQWLSCTVEPADATEKGLKYSSSDNSVATVSNTGYITAVKNGDAVITVTSVANNAIYGYCKVKVGKPVPVSSVAVAPEEKTLKVSDTFQLTVTVLPSNADDRSIEFSTSNADVATVSESGMITAKGPGSAIITATAKDGSGKKATCTLTVRQPVTGVNVSEKTVVIPKGGIKPLVASVVPANAGEKGLVFKTNNANVATVSNEGVVTGVSEGWAVITICAKENEAIYATCTVKVGLPVYVNSVTLDIAKADMLVGSTRQLGVTILPANADIKEVTYGSDNDAVATVSAAGLITARKAGTAKITVTAKDGSGKSASCTITVKQRANSIRINPNGYTLTKGAIAQLKAEVGPIDADNKEVTWTSSNPAVAAVSADGHVTAVNEGSCFITATSKDDPSIKASCTIVVGTPVTSVSLTPQAASMKTGETITLFASVLPTNASNKGVTWSWEPNTVGASIILTNGVVKAMKAGTVTVTAKAADNNNNGAQATCIITISGDPIATPTPTPAPTVTPTPGPTGGIWCRVNTEKGALNVRDKIGGAVIDKIPEKGTFLVVNWGTTWCQVYYNGRYGYVMTKFVQKISSEPTAAPTPAPTAPMGQTAQVNTAKGALNMRDKIGGAVIAKIPEKAFFIVTEYGATWCKAWYDGKTGYVMTKFVRLTGGSMPTPTPVPTPEPIIDYARVTTANGGLNLRDAINGTRVAVIPQGATVSVHSKGADWCRVSYSGKTGYVMTKFLSFGSAAPTETPTPAPEVVISYARVNTVTGGLNLRETPNGTRIAVIPQNAVIGVITKGADWSRVKYGDKVGYVMTKFLADTTATPAPSTPAPGNTLQCYGKVTTANGGGLNMRSGPATTYGRIASIKNGGVVEVYDKGAVWSRIKYNGTFGYVMSQYLTFSAERPSENPDPVIPSGAKAQVNTTAGSLNMRAGMGKTYAVVTQIPQKAYVEVLTYGPSWCYVSYNGLKGYVMTTYLTMIN